MVVPSPTPRQQRREVQGGELEIQLLREKDKIALHFLKPTKKKRLLLFIIFKMNLELFVFSNSCGATCFFLSKFAFRNYRFFFLYSHIYVVHSILPVLLV